MQQLQGYTYWNYMTLTDERLKELTEGSTNSKIQDIRSRDYRLTAKQRQALCIYLDSNGKYDDYRYFTEGCSPYNRDKEEMMKK